MLMLHVQILHRIRVYFMGGVDLLGDAILKEQV